MLILPFRTTLADPTAPTAKAAARLDILHPCPPCPTDAPPTNIPWTTNGGWFNINGCDIYVCYCTRETSPGNHDFVITQMQIGGGNTCPGDIDSLLTMVNKYFVEQNPMGFPCPPCQPPSYENNWREIRASCWGSPPDDPRVFYYCSATGWCMTPFRVCCDESGTRQWIEGATVALTTADCRASGCTEVACP